MQREYPDSEYLNSGNKDESLAFRQITQNACFGCQMLFTTKVLDNGVNLKDKAIKHIIIEQTDMVEFMQCLGRKRVQSPDDTIKAKRAGNVVLTAFPAFSVTNLLLVQCLSAVLQCSYGCIRAHPFPLIYAP